MTRVGFKRFDTIFLIEAETYVESHIIRLDALVYFIVIATFDDTSNPSNQPCH